MPQVIPRGTIFPLPMPPQPNSQHQDEREGVKWEGFREENRSQGASYAEPAGWGWGRQPLREVTLIVI